jgi:chromatin assembly factor 1 subunit A
MKSIDPFSTQYWEPTPPAVTRMDPPRLPLNALKSNSSTINVVSNAKPVKPFFTSASDLLKLNPAQPTQTALPTQSEPAVRAPAANAKPKKLVPQEDMPAFKQEIEGSNLSKVGLIEVLKKKFPGRSGAMIKSTLEIVAKRVGAKEADKRWVLIEEGGA